MFTQNQVRQLYVANAYASGLANAGDIYVNSQENDVFFNTVNADGEVMRTDLIDKSKIKSITFTPAEAMKYTSKATYVKLSDDAKKEGKPVAGQDFILNIRISQLNWHSDEAYGWKYGVAHATSSMTESDFYKTLAKSLEANMSRDPEKLLKVYCVTSSGAASSITSVNLSEVVNGSVPTGDVYAILIDEAEQAWSLGKQRQEVVYYEAHSDNVIVNSEEVKWGVETVRTGFTQIEDGHKIADMEWFYHGERGDIYRDAAWPNNWNNTMLVDPTKKYDTIDIHYYWEGGNHAVQKSEKDITIVCPATTGTAANEVAAKIVADLKTKIGSSINSLVATGTTPSTVILG